MEEYQQETERLEEMKVISVPQREGEECQEENPQICLHPLIRHTKGITFI